jgi:hypothetical protein
VKIERTRSRLADAIDEVSQVLPGRFGACQPWAYSTILIGLPELRIPR